MRNKEDSIDMCNVREVRVSMRMSWKAYELIKIGLEQYSWITSIEVVEFLVDRVYTIVFYIDLEKVPEFKDLTPDLKKKVESEEAVNRHNPVACRKKAVAHDLIWDEVYKNSHI